MIFLGENKLNCEYCGEEFNKKYIIKSILENIIISFILILLN